MSKFTAKVRRTNFKGYKCNSDCEWVKSFDDETTYEPGKTRFLIVGTLTPPDGRGQLIEKEEGEKSFTGYFYCSEKNDMYMFLDEAFKERETKLVDLKKKFRDSSWDPKFKDEIIKELKEREVAFLDIVDEAYAKKGSPKDDDIVCYKCKNESFKNVKFNDPNLKIIANSKNAWTVLEQILEEKSILKNNGLEYKELKFECVPQSLRGNYRDYANKAELINAWKEVLKKNI